MMRAHPHRRTPLGLDRCKSDRRVRPADSRLPTPGEMLGELAMTLACFLAVALAGNLLAIALGF